MTRRGTPRLPRFALLATALVSLLFSPIARAGLQPTADWSFEPNLLDAKVGTSVSTAGDINNDGYSDLLVGAPGFSNGQSGEGRVWLFLGNPGGLFPSAAWSIEGNQANSPSHSGRTHERPTIHHRGARRQDAELAWATS